MPLLDRSPHVRPVERRAALALGGILVLVLAGLALLAWLTPSAQHIGSVLQLDSFL